MYWSSTAPTLSSALGLPAAAAVVVAPAWPALEFLLSLPPPQAVPSTRRATAMLTVRMERIYWTPGLLEGGLGESELGAVDGFGGRRRPAMGAGGELYGVGPPVGVHRARRRVGEDVGLD